MTLLDKATEFMVTYPRPSMYGSGLPAGWDQGDTWHNLCASFCYRFADWMGWDPAPLPPYGSASTVAARSGTLRTDWQNAPVGAWHFWGKPTNDGHVGTDVSGGGALVAMGYKGVPWMVGANAGFDSVPHTTAQLPAAWPYRGWATNYAGGRVNLSGFAGSDVTPFPDEIPALKEPDDMLRFSTDNDGWLHVTGGSQIQQRIGHKTDPAAVEVWDILWRFEKNNGTFTALEWAQVNSWLAKTAPQPVDRNGVPGGSDTDLAPQLERIEKLITNFPKPPTTFVAK